jgi:hypothetical protein
MIGFWATEQFEIVGSLLLLYIGVKSTATFSYFFM